MGEDPKQRDGAQLEAAYQRIAELEAALERVGQSDTSHSCAQQEGDLQRARHMRFLESMARIDRAIRKATDLEQMMSDVLRATLEIFAVERVYLFFPCDPEAEWWMVPFEVTVPEYPGALALGERIPMSPQVEATLHRVLDADDVIVADHRYSGPTKEVSDRFGILTELHMALHPKTGQPWLFGLHQCRYQREWTDEDKELFRGIGRRLGDGLNSLLILRDLRASQEMWRSLTMHSADHIMLLDCAGRVEFINRALPGLGTERVLGSSVYDHAPESFRKAMVDCHDTVIQSQRIGTYELEYGGEGEAHRRFEVRVAPVLDGDETVALISSMRDITERKSAERRQHMMMRELDHRVKNNLALILSLAEETRRQSVSMDGFTESFRGRLLAIAGTHDALARGGWEGVDLTLILTLMLGPYLEGEVPRLSFDGSPVRLPASVATPITMSLHELATNAMKHGSLSNDVGRVAVRWRDEDGHLQIDWSERGGPEIAEPGPDGLGTMLIKGFIRHELGGTLTIDYESQGLYCNIRVPLAVTERTSELRNLGS